MVIRWIEFDIFNFLNNSLGSIEQFSNSLDQILNKAPKTFEREINKHFDHFISIISKIEDIEEQSKYVQLLLDNKLLSNTQYKKIPTMILIKLDSDNQVFYEEMLFRVHKERKYSDIPVRKVKKLLKSIAITKDNFKWIAQYCVTDKRILKDKSCLAKFKKLDETSIEQLPIKLLLTINTKEFNNSEIILYKIYKESSVLNFSIEEVLALFRNIEITEENYYWIVELCSKDIRIFNDKECLDKFIQLDKKFIEDLPSNVLYSLGSNTPTISEIKLHRMYDENMLSKISSHELLTLFRNIKVTSENFNWASELCASDERVLNDKQCIDKFETLDKRFINKLPSEILYALDSNNPTISEIKLYRIYQKNLLPNYSIEEILILFNNIDITNDNFEWIVELCKTDERLLEDKQCVDKFVQLDKNLILQLPNKILRAIDSNDSKIAEVRLHRIYKENLVTKYTSQQLLDLFNLIEISEDCLSWLDKFLVEARTNNEFEKYKKDFYNKLPENYLNDLYYYDCFSSVKQFYVLKKATIIQSEYLWSDTKVETKINYIFYFIKKYHNSGKSPLFVNEYQKIINLWIHDLYWNDSSNVNFEYKAILVLVEAIFIKDSKKDYFSEFDHYMYLYINELIQQNKDIVINSRLPICNVTIDNVKKCNYCEGKRWQCLEDDPDYAYCPRMDYPCYLKSKKEFNNYENYGSHIYSNFEGDWTLIELFDFAEIQVTVPMERNSHYVNKLSGWINRLIELKDQLKCEACGDALKSDLQYSKKHFARYNITVAECMNDYCIEKGKKIYFNHCWKCKEVIDSRINKLGKADRYLCLKCGNGKQNIDEPGEKCPKCSSFNMKLINKERNKFSCLDCGHFIVDNRYRY